MINNLLLLQLVDMGKQQGIVFVHLDDVPCCEAQTPCHDS